MPLLQQKPACLLFLTAELQFHFKVLGEEGKGERAPEQKNATLDVGFTKRLLKMQTRTSSQHISVERTPPSSGLVICTYGWGWFPEQFLNFELQSDRMAAGDHTSASPPTGILSI